MEITLDFVSPQHVSFFLILIQRYMIQFLILCHTIAENPLSSTGSTTKWNLMMTVMDKEKKFSKICATLHTLPHLPSKWQEKKRNLQKKCSLFLWMTWKLRENLSRLNPVFSVYILAQFITPYCLVSLGISLAVFRCSISWRNSKFS